MLKAPIASLKPSSTATGSPSALKTLLPLLSTKKPSRFLKDPSLVYSTFPFCVKTAKKP
jgi:hypothetical protein